MKAIAVRAYFAFIAFALLLNVHNAIGQDMGADLNFEGDITGIEVVQLPGFNTGELSKNAVLFLSKPNKKKKTKTPNYVKDSLQYTAQNSFLIYQKALGRHPDGEIAFKVIIELKEGRYRYTLKDFEFCPYERNRYGKFEPVKGKKRPLEKLVDKQGWPKRKKAISEAAAEYVNQLKATMSYREEVPSKNVSANESDW